MSKKKSAGKAKTVDLHFDDNNLAVHLFGPHGSHLKVMEKTFGVTIGARGGDLSIHGDKDKIANVERILDQFYDLLKKGYPITSRDIEQSVNLLKDEANLPIADLYLDSIMIPARKKVITPRTLGQKTYMQSILTHDMVFGIGPAGTGKTYLAMAMAVNAFIKGQVERIILTRPAVEAGEKLGFLPGNLVEKVNPYLRPLYDAMNDMLEFERIQKMLERGEIEVAPLAFMRGRTLNKAFVILDEAQNCTREQMKMFLTRLGFGSRGVITGDVTQIDLPNEKRSGLVHAIKLLSGIESIAIHYLTGKDVVRHPLVKEIISAYDREDQISKGSIPPN